MLTAQDIEGKTIYPLSKLIDPATFPVDILETGPVSELFDKINFTDPLLEFSERGFRAGVVVVIDEEFAVSVPGLDSVAIVIGGGGGLSAARVEAIVGDEPSGPPFRIGLKEIAVALRVSADILRPLKPGTDEPDLDAETFDITLGEIDIQFDSEGNLDFEIGGGISVPRCMVGSTGVLLTIGSLRWLTSATADLPPSTPAGFTGVYFDDVIVEMPQLDSPVGAIGMDDVFLGTGGFSGIISRPGLTLAWDGENEDFTGDIHGELFGFKGGVTAMSVEFRQNALVACDITGDIFVPYLNKRIGLSLGLDGAGSLTATAALPNSTPAETGVRQGSPGYLIHLDAANVLSIDIASLSFKVPAGDVPRLGISGRVAPGSGALDFPPVEMTGLWIDTRGHIRTEGDGINLPTKYLLNFHGFEIEVSKLGFGNTEDGGKWLGFTGGVKLVAGMPAGASVEGLRFTWYPNGRIEPSLKGVGVNFEVPNTLKFAGEVSYDKDKQQFRGAVKLDLIALKMQVDATAVFGMKDGDQTKPYLALYLAAEFPAGIPLAATGLGLYGAAGLFAMNMEPDRGAGQPWYEMGSSSDWYHKSPTGVTALTKWKPVPGSMAFGAGVTLGTIADNGHTFSGRMLLAIIFPGPILLLQGAANLLQERAALDKEANFQALAVLDGRAGTLQLGLDAKYRFDKDNGNLIDINGSAEGFFNFNDPNAWHLNIGLDEPRDRRLHASLFKLFDSYAYVMLNPQQLAMGAWVGFQQNWTFGPLSVGLEAWIDGNARVSWKPAHFYGDLALHGSAKLAVFGFGASITVDAQIAADVFDPLHITGDFSVAIDLPWPLPDFSAGVNLEWGPQPTIPPFPLPLKEVAIEHFKASTSWPLPRDARNGAKRMLFPNFDRDEDGFWDNPEDPNIDPKYKMTQPASLDDLPIVPLDSRPHLTFARNINDDALVGVNAMPVNPQFERIGDPATDTGPATIRYGMSEVVLDKWAIDIVDGNEKWMPVARKGVTANDGDLPTLFGSWAPVPQMPGGGGRNVGQVKLWLWSKTPFEYTRRTSRAWDEWFTDEHSDYPCQTVIPQGWNFDNIAVNPNVPDPFFHPDERGLVFTQHIINVIRTAGFSIEQLAQPSHGLNHAFGISGKNLDGTTIIALPQPTNLARVMITDSRLVDPTKFRSFDSKGDECIGMAGGPPEAPYIDIAGEGLTQLFYHAGEYVRFELAQNLKGVRGTAYHSELHQIVLVEFNTGTLSSIDVATGAYKVLGTGYIKPIDVALTADGTTAYITEDIGTLLRVNLTSGKADRAAAVVVSTGMSEPCQIALDEANRKAYVVEFSGKGRLLSIQLAGPNTGTQTTIVSGLVKAFGLLLAKDGVSAYVCEVGDGPIHTRLTRINVLKGTSEILFNDMILTFFLRWENEDQNSILAMQLDPDQNWLARLDVTGTNTQPEILERDWKEHQWGVLVLPNDRYVVCGETKLMMIATTLLIPKIVDVGGSVFSRHFAEEFARWKQAGAVLEPHTKYRLTVTTTTRMVGDTGGQLDGLDETKTLKEFAFFRTAGPPGAAQLTAPAGSEAVAPPPQRKYVSPLDDLSRYVRKTMPPLVAPTPTNPVPSQLAYRAYDVGLAFDENYVDLMYRIGRRDLSIHMHDSNGAIRNDEGHRLILANQWSQAETITLRDHEDRWISMLGAGGCNLVPINSIVKDTTFNATTVAHVLPPSSLCEARLIPALLHESFGGYKNDAADGPVGTIDRWQVRDLVGPNSHWKITEKPNDFELSQTTQAATSVLVWSNAPTTELPDTDQDQPLNWTDYRLTANLEFTDGRAGVVLRYRGVDQHYRFVMDKGTTNTCELIRVASGAETPLDTNTRFKLPTIPFAISVEATGDTFKVYVEKELILSATDSAIPSGSVGFFTSGTKSAIFTDMYVDDFRTAAPVVHRFSFLSSRFTNFKDHMESFEDKTVVAKIADLANAAPFVSAAQPDGSSLGDAESRAYDGLLALVPGVAATPVVRVTRVQQGEDAIAFLVQSPEPLDWKRTSVKVLRADPKDSRFNEILFNVLRKADGSGLMIVSPGPTPSGSFLPEGQYRLVFTYRRDNRTMDPNSDVLSEAGNTAPEVATLDLPWQTHGGESGKEIAEFLVPA
jgi:uncharacterized protein DUF6603